MTTITVIDDRWALTDLAAHVRRGDAGGGDAHLTPDQRADALALRHASRVEAVVMIRQRISAAAGNIS